MKSVIICLLLPMIIQYAAAAQTEESPPIFSIKGIKLEATPSPTPSPTEYVRRETGRVAVFKLEENIKYLMRVDPPDHCTRFVICGADPPTLNAAPLETCYDQENSILFNRQGNERKIHKRIKSTAKVDTVVMSDVEEVDDYIKLERKGYELSLLIKIIKLSSNGKEQDGTKIEKLTMDMSQKTYLRVETSSFYCNVHIGTTDSVDNQVPALFGHLKGQTYDGVNIDPFEFGEEPKKSLREGFGPLFRTDKAYTRKIDVTNLKVNNAIQCPFTHDWMGFARWSLPQNEDKQYVKNFWKGPAFHYHLESSRNSECGKKEKPFSIDIDIDEVVNPKTKGPKRCFGFALVFGSTFDATGLLDPMSLDPKNTFEFYPVSMMFLAPDSDAIRELRVSRDNLHKIRISFIKDSGKSYAVVEYGFLNDNIGGVREYVQLKDGAVDTYKAVTLLQEGFCTARVHNTPEKIIPPNTERCMSISGCDVLQE